MPETIERLNNLVNALNKENAELKEQLKPREYVFAPDGLTNEEQEIIGKYVGTPLIELIEKWLKSKADINNDLLLHNSKNDPIMEAKFKLAVLMYDDWRMFIKNCKQIFDKTED